jgi:hypothetical protein
MLVRIVRACVVYIVNFIDRQILRSWSETKRDLGVRTHKSLPLRHGLCGLYALFGIRWGGWRTAGIAAGSWPWG